MRFAEPWKPKDDLSVAERLEQERLTFMELTQGTYSTHILTGSELTESSQSACGGTQRICPCSST